MDKWSRNKKIVVAILVIATLAGIYYFGPALKAGLSVNVSIKVTSTKTFLSGLWTGICRYWLQLWALLVASFQGVIRQIVESVHQTLAIVLCAWILKRLKNVMDMAQPKLDAILDTKLTIMTAEQREYVKRMMHNIIDGNIDLVESVFAEHNAKINGVDRKDAQQARQRSQAKLSSAVLLVLKDMSSAGLEKMVAVNGVTEEFMQQLVAEIEKRLLAKKTNPTTASMFNTGSNGNPAAGFGGEDKAGRLMALASVGVAEEQMKALRKVVEVGIAL